MNNNRFDINLIIRNVLRSIKAEREREIIARRFGLFERRETLEQIGELLSITRERVRQLEKTVMTNLSSQPHQTIPHIKEIESNLTKALRYLGNVARLTSLSEYFGVIGDKIHQAQVGFLGHLSPQFVVIGEDQLHYPGVGLSQYHDHSEIRSYVASIVGHVEDIGSPAHIEAIHGRLGRFEHDHLHGLASLSKKLAHLNRRWGLHHWPAVNPKNIRDKIYLVLEKQGKPLHFTQIAKAIHTSSFRRSNVTQQAIHNELIKDDRFILVGRGIYALSQWGYQRGTVADVLTKILTDAKKPLSKDEIIKRVLQKRIVKEPTIVLNLQNKPQFKKNNHGLYEINPQA